MDGHFFTESELLHLLSLVAEMGYCDGQGSTLSSNPDVAFRTPEDYGKQFTDTLKK